jgi:PAS domain S-box-containing protein
MSWADSALKRLRLNLSRKGVMDEQGPQGDGFGEVLTPDGRDMLDLLPAYVTIQDRDFIIHHANEAFRQDFGDAVGRPCFEVYKGQETICPECPLMRTLKEGRPCSWEETLRTLQEETVHTVAHATPIRDADGEIIGAVKVSSEIAEAKRLQKQLELSQQEYKALFTGVPCYISVQDRDFKIIKTNRYFDQDFGRGIGRRCYEAYKGRTEKCPDCPVEKTFQDGEIHSSEETVRMKSGKEAQMIVYTAPLYDLSGQIFSVMEMSTNISEVKRLQRELTTLGEAVAVTAHGIKNILNGLTGGAYVVQSGLKRGDSELAQQGWEMVKEGVEMVRELVKDILLVSKERVPEYEDTDPNELAQKVWTLFEQRANDLGIELVLELHENTDVSTPLDEKGVHTVLSNLVSNAMDACTSDAEGGVHRICIRVKDLGAEGVTFEVDDNGIGIPDNIREKLLREVISTKGSRGTGLGLVATNKIVTEHGGTLTWDSEAGKGTLFRAHFPRVRVGWDEVSSVSGDTVEPITVGS